MAYSIPKTWSLEKLRTYTVKVIAALVALKALGKIKVEGMEALQGDWLQALIEKWRAERATVIATRDARDEARDLVVEKNAVVNVFDMQWDATVGQLSSLSFMLAGSKANKDPYKTLFGTIKAKSLQALGPAKATVAADRLVEKINAMGDAKLLPLANVLDFQSRLLGAASEEDVAAETALLSHSIARMKLIRRLEMTVATTEVELLSRFPGRDDIVRAVLGTAAPKRTKKTNAETADDEVEDSTNDDDL